MKKSIKTSIKALAVSVALACGINTASAENLTGGIQYGIAYLVPLVMKHQGLYEKRATEQGIQSAMELPNFAGPADVFTCMKSGSCQFGVVGTPTVVLINEKTNGDYKLIGPSIDQPMLLNTRNPNVKTIADFKETDKIAVPSIKTSVQAVTIQMAAAKQWGFDKATSLDARTVSMSHPDAEIALKKATGAVNSHMGAAPFQYRELEFPGVHTVLNSYDVLRDGKQDAGKTYMFTGLVASSKWAASHPKEFAALKASYSDAIDWINADKVRAAKFYQQYGKTTEGLNEILAQLSSPDVKFSKTVNGLDKYAVFMNKIGTTKTVPTADTLLFK